MSFFSSLPVISVSRCACTAVAVLTNEQRIRAFVAMNEREAELFEELEADP